MPRGAALFVLAIRFPLVARGKPSLGAGAFGNEIVALVADRPIKLRLAEFDGPRLVEAHARYASYAAFPRTGSSSGAGSETGA